jgi:UDP-GlcNAc3NAcA epimerase
MIIIFRISGTGSTHITYLKILDVVKLKRYVVCLYMKICSIIGTRPQFIKAVLISQKLRNIPDVEEVIINTNQHFDHNMSDVFFTELQIPIPKYNLGINGMSHAQMTGHMMIEIEKIFLVERPDKVLVYGDCDTTLAGALVAAKMQICLVHVESGLRSFDNRMPEEINRVLVDQISTVLFCPTKGAVDNLKREGIYDRGVCNKVCKVVLTGDLMIELLQLNENRIISNVPMVLNRYGLRSLNYVLMTIHRAANTTVPILTNIIEAISRVRLHVVWPIHPRTRKIIVDNGLQLPKNLMIIDPISYLDMMALLSSCWMVITDSGGLQKEAYAWEKLCSTLRNSTEWVETLIDRRNILLDPEVLTVSELVKGINNQDKATSSLEWEEWDDSRVKGGNTSDEIISVLIA